MSKSDKKYYVSFKDIELAKSITQELKNIEVLSRHIKGSGTITIELKSLGYEGRFEDDVLKLNTILNFVPFGRIGHSNVYEINDFKVIFN